MATSQLPSSTRRSNTSPGTGTAGLVSSNEQVPAKSLEPESAVGATLEKHSRYRCQGEHSSSEPSMQSSGEAATSQSIRTHTKSTELEKTLGGRNVNPTKLPVWAYAAAAAQSELQKEPVIRLKQDRYNLQDNNVFSSGNTTRPVGARRYRTMPVFQRPVGKIEIPTNPPVDEKVHEGTRRLNMFLEPPNVISNRPLEYIHDTLPHDSTGKQPESPQSSSTTATSKSNGAVAGVVVSRVVPTLNLSTSKFLLGSNEESCRVDEEKQSLGHIFLPHGAVETSTIRAASDFVPIVQNLDDLFRTNAASEQMGVNANEEQPVNATRVGCNKEANPDQTMIHVEDFRIQKPNGCFYNFLHWYARQPTV